jgi:uncharacterized tannase-like protein DUF6351
MDPDGPFQLRQGLSCDRLCERGAASFAQLPAACHTESKEGELFVTARFLPVGKHYRKIPNGSPANPDLIRLALLAHNEWLENIFADTSTDPYPVKVIRNKPATLKDACWDAAGVKHEEPATPDGPGICNTLFPVYADPRIYAGGPLAGDILKCQLKPVASSDYTVSFTSAELARLNAIFPEGVCDWSKPGVNQLPPDDSWLRYVAPAGTWVRMGHSSFGRN